MNETPCCEKCHIYLDYKDAHQCGDGECACHTPNPITASRERTAKEFDQLYRAEFRWVKERMHQPSASDWLSQALLQHEATVKEEVIAIARKIIGDKPCTTRCEDCKAWVDLLRTTQPTI